jgi:hypothetical protein
MARQMPLSLPRGNGVMKHIAQEDFAERVPVNQQDFDSTLGPSYRTQAGFSDEQGLNHSGGRLGKVKEAEIVVWILIVLLAVVTVIAFDLLWLRIGGTEDRISYGVEALPSIWNTYAARLSKN